MIVLPRVKSSSADEQREDAADEEGQADHRQVHEADALVIEREEPRA